MTVLFWIGRTIPRCVAHSVAYLTTRRMSLSSFWWTGPTQSTVSTSSRPPGGARTVSSWNTEKVPGINITNVTQSHLAKEAVGNSRMRSSTISTATTTGRPASSGSCSRADTATQGARHFPRAGPRRIWPAALSFSRDERVVANTLTLGDLIATPTDEKHRVAGCVVGVSYARAA